LINLIAQQIKKLILPARQTCSANRPEIVRYQQHGGNGMAELACQTVLLPFDDINRYLPSFDS
jgi:hypothetical protein